VLNLKTHIGRALRKKNYWCDGAGRGRPKLDSYLNIAERVLRSVRKPMSAQKILDAAYRAKIVPHTLYGKTQHKTLQARLSEHILRHKSNSVFYRTAPGHFFLNELDNDPNIPDRYKVHFTARRRVRDLTRDLNYGFDVNFVEEFCEKNIFDWEEFVAAATKEGAIHHIGKHDDPGSLARAWAFPIARRGSKVLNYRIGKYRDDTGDLTAQKIIGFPSQITFYDSTLFSYLDLGARHCGLNALVTDLDISIRSLGQLDEVEKPSILFGSLVRDKKDVPSVLCFMEWQCPSWFEPTRRRLSLNDMRWMNVDTPPNNMDEFESWSNLALTMLIGRQHEGMSSWSPNRH